MAKLKNQQTDLFAKNSKSYGGILLNKSKNRQYARPISISQTMHLVLRSSKAIGDKSFKVPKHQKRIEEIIGKFSFKYGVRVISLANVGTHLHLHVKITKRAGYLRFIRAVTAAIAMFVSGRNRWTVQQSQQAQMQQSDDFQGGDDKTPAKEKFWDYRPFTRIIEGFRALLNMRDYIHINQLEGLGVSRLQARMMLATAQMSKHGRPKLC